MIKRDVIIAVLATFCLTTTLFIVLPTRSSPSAGEYDSWADINDDGKINMYDIGYTAQRFGASGDPTKNVNVTNWSKPPYRTGNADINVSWYSGGGASVDSQPVIDSGGYSKISFFLEPLDMNINGSWELNGLDVSIFQLFWGSEPYTGPGGHHLWAWESIEDLNVTVWSHGEYDFSWRTAQANLFDVKGPCLEPLFSARWHGDAVPPGGAEGWVTLRVAWYLRDE